ncbi:hypothetical protein ABT255_02035 [Streptomyces mirabilis]|uniref:hypothetical protein n=1 Tax=Streptomyces mirabilis TaxID=68239 RepID=UPI00331D1A1A
MEHFEPRVSWRGMDPESGEDLWAVVHIGACLAAGGAWEYEPPPSLRNDNWLARCPFSRKEALRRAAVAVNQIKFNSRTFARWNKHYASRSALPSRLRALQTLASGVWVGIADPGAGSIPEQAGCSCTRPVPR